MELSPNEQALLAREVAADGFRVGGDIETECDDCGCKVYALQPEEDYRRAVQYGWDAAMEYVEKQRGKA